MGNVKSHIERLDEQVAFVEKTMAVINIHDHQAVMNFEHLDLFREILANLKMIQCWTMLPDYHQAAMHVLDEAHIQEKRIASADITLPVVHFANGKGKLSLDDFSLAIRHEIQLAINAPDSEKQIRMMNVAALSLLSVGKYIVPQHRKEARNG